MAYQAAAGMTPHASFCSPVSRRWRVPETVSVALTEPIGEIREGLLALVVGAGLQVMAAIMIGRHCVAWAEGYA